MSAREIAHFVGAVPEDPSLGKDATRSKDINWHCALGSREKCEAY